MKKYFVNCFLLLLPIFLWNAFFVQYLSKAYHPENFNLGVPSWLLLSENTLRICFISLSLAMAISFKSRKNKFGWVLYAIGVLVYFFSWIMVMLYPQSDWSLSKIGFMAPAYTTLIWLLGIGLIGNKSIYNVPHVSKLWVGIVIAFVIIHTLHTSLVFDQL